MQHPTRIPTRSRSIHRGGNGLRGLTAVLPLAVLLGMIVGALGCANGEFRFGDPLDRKLTLTEAQHKYTLLVRWSDFQKAKQFVVKEDRDLYIERMKGLRDARFTEFESEAVEFDEGKHHATVRVTYKLYHPANPYESELTEVQKWSRDGVQNIWRVQSAFEGLPDLAAN